VTMDSAHDQLTLGVTGSTCSGQFIILQCVYCERYVSIAARSASEARDTIHKASCAQARRGGAFPRNHCLGPPLDVFFTGAIIYVPWNSVCLSASLSVREYVCTFVTADRKNDMK